LHKDEAHHVFAVVAPDVDVQPILARLSLDLQVLARGHEVVCSSGTVTIFGGLGLVLADSVQLGDSPEFSVIMENFRRVFHEPYYRDYISDDIKARLKAAGFGAIKAESHLMTRVWAAQKAG
jgi:hypothetical protein